MNNSKNKLILSLYIGCIALSVATLSMSIAWFATSTRVQVNTIDISIDCDRELFISTERDGENMNLKIVAQLSFGISLQGRRAKGVIVRAYYRLQQGVRQFVRAHFRHRR